MAEAKYLPTTDAGKAIWLNNFSTKLAIYGTQLGVSNAEISNVQQDNAAFQYVINLLEQYRQSILQLTGYKNMMKHAVGQQHIGAIPLISTPPATPPPVPEGIFDRATKLASRIKTSPNYNDNIGRDLGIVSSIPETDVDSMQPRLKIKLNVGKPHIQWTKGDADATELYVDRNDGLGFVLVGRFTRNNYIDSTPLPADKKFEEWHYKAIFTIADTLVGLYSNVVSVDVKRM